MWASFTSVAIYKLLDIWVVNVKSHGLVSGYCFSWVLWGKRVYLHSSFHTEISVGYKSVREILRALLDTHMNRTVFILTSFEMLSGFWGVFVVIISQIIVAMQDWLASWLGCRQA